VLEGNHIFRVAIKLVVEVFLGEILFYCLL
jgi:hypothetical protein